MCTKNQNCVNDDQSVCLHAAAVADHTADQGWELLENGVILFDDGGAILPGGRIAHLS